MRFAAALLLSVPLVSCGAGSVAHEVMSGSGGDMRCLDVSTESSLGVLISCAEQGDARAQNDLGVSYRIGEGDVRRDDGEAVRWFRLAAEQGHANAQFNLGVMYNLGEGVGKDDAEAVRWFRLAAEGGHVDAQFNLGVRYSEGDGVPEDDGEAVRWFRLAGEQGHVDAQFNLGVRYSEGEGVPEDGAEAVRWYRLAAEQGHVSAQYDLGWMYESGEDVPEDLAEAERWYRLAADQGHAGARSYFGGRYTSNSTNGSTNRLIESSLVGDWNCDGMTISLERSGRYTLEDQSGGHRGTWRVPDDSPNTLVLEYRTDPRWIADVSVDGSGTAIGLTAFRPFSGICSK